jgi:hypothetical protein
VGFSRGVSHGFHPQPTFGAKCPKAFGERCNCASHTACMRIVNRLLQPLWQPARNLAQQTNKQTKQTNKPTNKKTNQQTNTHAIKHPGLVHSALHSRLLQAAEHATGCNVSGPA